MIKRQAASPVEPTMIHLRYRIMTAFSLSAHAPLHPDSLTPVRIRMLETTRAAIAPKLARPVHKIVERSSAAKVIFSIIFS